MIVLFAVQGDVAETARSFFETSSVVPPAKSSTLTLAEVRVQAGITVHS